MARFGFGALAKAFLCAGVFSASAFAQSDTSALVPLETYVQQNDITNDPVAAEYVALRCVGFYRAGATEMDSVKDPAMAPVKESALARASDLLTTVIALDMVRSGRSKTESSTAMNGAASLMDKAYADRMKTDKKGNAGIGGDPVFTGDSEICRALPSSDPQQ